jgi:hypothetical protein
MTVYRKSDANNLAVILRRCRDNFNESMGANPDARTPPAR